MEMNMDSTYMDSYMNVLTQLSDAMKKELIIRLSATIQKPKGQTVHTMNELPSFKGDWGKSKPVEEYCEELRGNIQPRDVESWR